MGRLVCPLPPTNVSSGSRYESGGGVAIPVVLLTEERA